MHRAKRETEVDRGLKLIERTVINTVLYRRKSYENTQQIINRK